MADIKPNRDLAKRRLEVQKSELRLSLERMDLRKLEIADELRKIQDNIAATEKAIQGLDLELIQLSK